ncbi:Imm8 family immunity protein [Pantoea ananatis]|uniref:Imm8 family immunity protein n=1 Tax=Pantoea ananas TaxID=553 RepID=UPI0023AF9BFD|nr:Imm8 family immunity protein [Pantoea ananatis]
MSYLKACTSDGLCEHHWLPKLMRHMLLVRKYHLDGITKTIISHIRHSQNKDWWKW